MMVGYVDVDHDVNNSVQRVPLPRTTRHIDKSRIHIGEHRGFVL